MTFSYGARLVCISLASFFLLHLALGLLIKLASPRILRFTERLDARRAATLLLLARLVPPATATLGVAAFCIPSYLRFESNAGPEQLSRICLAAALLAAIICTASLFRSLRAFIRSSRYLSSCRSSGHVTPLPGEPRPALLIDAQTPVLALSGIFHSRIIVSRLVMEALTPDQLAAVLLHERAHRTGRDNLKRLALYLSPNLLPCINSFTNLETAWARASEWAADDSAAAGDPNRSISLAAAMLRVARLGICSEPAPLTTSLLPDSTDLATRVDRLLRTPQTLHPPKHQYRPILFALAFILAISQQTQIQTQVHELLENLTH